MSRISFVRLFSILAVAFAASAFSVSTITYAVGTCRPGLRSFHTISSALAAVPSANVIDICPGTYNEQLQITHPVTLEGVSNGTSARAILAPPAHGLVTNATDDRGFSIAAQLWVNNASGPVNISDLTLDASGNGVPLGAPSYGPFVVGIFYQNSSGTVNRVATRNQHGNRNGVGIWAQGGSSNPLVTIENSSVHDYDNRAIEVETNSATPELTAVIKGNEITTGPQLGGFVGISNEGGDAVTVTSNLLVFPGDVGILDFGSGPGSISANTVVNAYSEGIFAGISAHGAPVTSNRIFGSGTGIVASPSVAPIQGNSITNSAVGIDFFYNANPNVHSNIIMDTDTALGNLNCAITSNNKYFNVGTIRGGC